MRRFAALAAAPVAALISVAALPAASGGLDPSFGVRGKVFTDFGEGDGAAAMALQADGKIVVVGETQTTGYRFAIARYRSNGRLDSSFDRDGKAVIACPSCGAYSVAVQRDGAMIVGGIELGESGRFALIRLKPDGSRDLAFGIRGWAESGFEGGVFAIAVQQDGKILVAGQDYDPNAATPAPLAVARLTPDGRLDTSFGRSGRVLIFLGGSDVRAGFLQPDGKFVVLLGGFGRRADLVALCRIDAAGRIDRSFGRGGLARTPIADDVYSPASLAVQSDGKPVVAGARGGSLLVARYNRLGKLDRTFGRAGFARSAFPKERLLAGGVGIDSKGRIVIAGLRLTWVRVGIRLEGRSRFVLLRLSRRGRPDTAFGTRGQVDGLGTGYDTPSAIAIQRNDRILVSGTRNSSQSAEVNKTAFFVARYLGR